MVRLSLGKLTQAVSWLTGCWLTESPANQSTSEPHLVAMPLRQSFSSPRSSLSHGAPPRPASRTRAASRATLELARRSVSARRALDSADRAVAHSVTDSAGTFVLVAPAAGVYRVGFEIFGWERLVGPVDTLRDGELRERVYPLTFESECAETASSPRPSPSGRRREDPGAARAATTPDADIRFPKSMRGSGTHRQRRGPVRRRRPRSGALRLVASDRLTHPDYLAALRAHAPADALPAGAPRRSARLPARP